MTQKGVHTEDKFDSFSPVYIKQQRDFDGLINITLNEATLPLNKDWRKLLQKVSEVCQRCFGDFLFICNQDNSLFNSIKKTYHAYTLTELLKMEVGDVAYTKVAFWKF